MNKKRYKSIYFLSFVLFLLTGVVFFQISSAYSKTVQKEKELEVIEIELLKEKEKNIELEEEKYYIQTDEYIINKARQEFNLIQEGEVIYIKKGNE
jgi:cell division protein FtsB